MPPLIFPFLMLGSDHTAQSLAREPRATPLTHLQGAPVRLCATCRSVGCACGWLCLLLDAPVRHILCRTLSRFGRPKSEFGARSGANCPACTNCGDLRGKVSENCVIRRAKWGSAARWLRSAVRLVECRWGRDLSAQIANLGPSLAQIA